MKKLILLSAVIMSLLLTSSVLFAQTVSNGDTLEVGPLNSLGQPSGALNEAIKGDTTATGERAHSVYKLTRGTQYILTEVIQADFPLTIVADAPGDDITTRPPVIRCGLNEDGSNVNNWWHIYDDATFKNIWVSGIDVHGEAGINWIAQTVNSTNKTIRYEGCIFEFPYTTWGMFNDSGNNNTLISNNCVFMNVGNPTVTGWNGAIIAGGVMDSVVYKNSTFFNFGCFATNGTSFYTEIDHCTFVNSSVHPVESHGDVIKVYTNNLWVNCHAFSDDTDEISRHYDREIKGLMNYAEIQFDPQALDSLYGPGGVYGKDYDPNGDGVCSEGDLVWTLRNNNWYYTQPIRDYWDQFPQVHPNPWMNGYNQALFDNADNAEDTWVYSLKNYAWENDTSGVIIWENPDNFDHWTIVDSEFVDITHETFKYFSEENTTNVDPGIIDMKNCDELMALDCIITRNESYGIANTEERVKWHNVDNYLAFTWPLDFDLAYTADLTGDDGLPIGDLFHWYPEAYEQWITGVEEDAPSAPADFTLYANYPNPFNPTTTIKFDINTVGKVKLTIHNVLGEEVKTLVNQVKNTGSYDVQWDGTNNLNQKVSSGVYFYRLEQGNHTQVQKMMLVK